MFIDEIRIYAQAGHGGKGCVAFQREKYRPKGGPSGGNGGRGGDVILEANHDLNNLINQYYQPRLIAPGGEQGLGKGMDGHAGKDLVVKVPCGTLVWRVGAAEGSEPDTASEVRTSRPALPSSLSSRPMLRLASGASFMEMDLSQSTEDTVADSQPGAKGELVVDLTQHGQRFVLCKGGRGGLGNRNFATATRQTPRFAQPGEPGDEDHFLFELRIMAEVGLVGYPNAGKSTLLTAISHARPKIAPYPFTTLHPQIGIVGYTDFHRLTVCDVPGLIAGAHRNVGLGHEFLRHIERCVVLVVLLDMAGTDDRAPWDDYKTLLQELELYDPGLLDRPRLVVANKMDEPTAEENLKKFKRRIRKTPVLPIAAAFDVGIAQFKQAIRQAVAETAVKQDGASPNRPET
jgi:GTPase